MRRRSSPIRSSGEPTSRRPNMTISRSTLTALLAGMIAISGCTSLGGSGDVDRKLADMQREIDALKAEKATAPTPPVGAAPQPTTIAQATPAPAPPPPAPAADKPPPPAEVPLTWRVTPDITFKPGMRLQTRYAHDGGTNNNDISLFRFRLKASGEAWKAKYGLEMKIDGTGRTGVSPNAAVENAWLDYTFVPEYLVGRAGLYDVPFSRDALTSDSKLLFMDRSLIKDALTGFGLADNGIGVMARGRPLGGHLEYDVGAFNNDRFDGLRTTRRRSGQVMPAGRIAVDLLDPAPH